MNGERLAWLCAAGFAFSALFYALDASRWFGVGIFSFGIAISLFNAGQAR